MLKPQNNIRRSVFSLDGIWEYTKNPSEKPQFGFIPDGILAVPASWNEQHNDLYHYKGRLWYQKKFEFAIIEGKKILLRFAGVLFAADFYLNGHYLGSNSAGHLPIEFEVEKLLNDGENLLVVGVDGNVQEHQAIGRGDFYEYGGIHRPVTLETVSKKRFLDLKVETSSDGDLKLNWKCSGGELVCFSINGQNFEADVGNEELICKVSGISPWSCDMPKLYDLKAKIFEAGILCDCYTIKIGFRTVEVRSRQLFLNGARIRLTGFGKHEDFYIIGKGTNQALYIRDYELMRWCGANSFRSSHYPYSEEMLELADLSGFLVIDELPFVDFNDQQFNDDELLKNAKDTIKKLIDRDFNHPSVISWSMGNECETQMPKSEKFFKEIFATARLYDSSRPLTYVAYTRPGEDHAYQFADIIGINRYFGWYDYAAWGRPVAPGDLSGGVKMLEKDLDKFSELYDKPLIVTEFGVDCVPGTHSIFCQQFSEEFQAEFLKRYITCMQKRPDVAGMHVWCFADFNTNQDPLRVQGNRKGIFSRNREPKMAAFTVRKLWTSANDSGVSPLGDENDMENFSNCWQQKG